MRLERYMARLMEKVEKTGDGCLREKRMRSAIPGTPLYRAVYIKVKGPVAKNTDLRATCGDPTCVNPEHRRPVQRILRYKQLLCRACRVEFPKTPERPKHCPKCADRRRARKHSHNSARAKAKAEAIAALGGACACCGESQAAFLSVDHVLNDGGDDRRKAAIDGKSTDGWRLARRSGYDPERYQLLCFNCNMAKQICGGVCPHQWGRLLTEM